MRATPDFDFALGDNAEMIREAAGRFADEQIAPLAAKVDREDWANRRYYDAYQCAAAEMIRRTDSDEAKWTVVAGDDKRQARLLVLKAVCEALER